MTVSSGTLRDLVAAATPRKLDERTRTHVLFLYDGEPDVYKGFDHEADAQLVALAPDLALLLADTMDTIEPLAHPGSEWQVLLARFRDLERRATE